jgi:hypothetical protein
MADWMRNANSTVGLVEADSLRLHCRGAKVFQPERTDRRKRATNSCLEQVVQGEAQAITRMEELGTRDDRAWQREPRRFEPESMIPSCLASIKEQFMSDA